jgi:hypothetical protein
VHCCPKALRIKSPVRRKNNVEKDYKSCRQRVSYRVLVHHHSRKATAPHSAEVFDMVAGSHPPGFPLNLEPKRDVPENQRGASDCDTIDRLTRAVYGADVRR